MAQLLASYHVDMTAEKNAFQGDRTLLLEMLGGFSVLSVALAMLLGFLFSWAIIQPVRRIDRSVAGIAAGDFRQRIEVGNPDEVCSLSTNSNRKAERLGIVYAHQASPNKKLVAGHDALGNT